MSQSNTITVLGQSINIDKNDYISITDMLKVKDGDFFISDWLRNRNTLEYLGVWERIHNPDFNYGEFAIIKSQSGLNSYKISVKEWVAKTNAIGLSAKAGPLNEIEMESLNSDILIYLNQDGSIKIDVRLEKETVWLTQDQMATLFGKAKSTINEHIKNIFAEGELEEKVAIRKFRITTPHVPLMGMLS